MIVKRLVIRYHGLWMYLDLSVKLIDVFTIIFSKFNTFLLATSLTERVVWCSVIKYSIHLIENQKGVLQTITLKIYVRSTFVNIKFISDDVCFDK